MKKITRMGLLVMVGMLVALPVVFGQSKPVQTQRRPAANAPASDVAPHKAQDGSGASYILDGLPVLLTLHHDTEVGTNKPVDVWAFVIELQVMNSDGNLEPEGLQIFNFYTKYPRDAKNDINPHNALDCKRWARLQTTAMQKRNPKLKTWPYVEFVTAVGARVLQTNEDGAVWWSDDIECWGSSDRFSPF
jgi:hypothetical protein